MKSKPSGKEAKAAGKKKAWTFSEEEIPVEKVEGDKKGPIKTIPFFSLWKYASRWELVGVFIGCLASIGIGAIVPAQILVFGNIVTDIAPILYNPTEEALLNALLPLIYQMIYLGLGMLVGGYIAQCMWVLTGEYQTRRIREMYVHAILRQEMGWFDKADEGSLSTRLALDTQLVQDAISEKAGATLQAVSQFITGFVIAFVKGWRLALVMLAGIPIMAIAGGVIFRFVTRFMTEGQDSYADAGAIAESAIAGIRTVYSFSLQKRFEQKYDGHLAKAERANIIAGLVIGWGFGIFLFIMFATYGLAFWYGSTLVINGTDGMNAGSVLVVFLSMIMGAMALMLVPTNIATFGTGRAAAYKIWRTIDRKPAIDTDSEEGLKPAECRGEISFNKIKFNYPTRPDAKILRRLTLDIKPGMTVAFVGPSGSGKSTTVALIQRFYDATSGTVKIDGHDVKDLNLKWLRQQIGIVSQEPVLFNMSIRENLKLGARDRTTVTNEQIEEACKMANCHNFIIQLPMGYDTMVGEHGGMLSGGQKQRIAIARALLKDPKILLLDEATSALDTTSERLVQKALDGASKGRTTVVIAHRLSTIRNADLIVVLSKGKMAESGTHDELYNMGGIYTELVNKQKIKLKADPTASAVDTEMDDAELEETLKNETVKIATEVQTVSGTEIQLEMHEVSATKSLSSQTPKYSGNPMWRVLRGMTPEWVYLLLGSLAAVVMGAVFPIYGFIFSKIIVILQKPVDEISPGPMEGANLYAFILVLIGIAALFGCGIQVAAFFYAGAKYTRRIRLDTFTAMLKQEMGFYDVPGNSVGALTAALATDAAGVNDVVTKVWGDVIQLGASAVTGIVIAFIYSWQLALVILACTPFIAAATAFESQVHAGFEDKTKKAYTESGEIATEAIREIRTVTSLGVQSEFEGRFITNIAHPHRLALRKAYVASLGYGAHQGFNMLTSAVGFYAGIRFIGKGWVDFQDMFVVILCLMITAGTMGRTSLFVSKYIKAKHNAESVFSYLDRKTLIDPEQDGEDAGRSMKSTDINLKDITFRYPARPDVPIFSGEFQLDGKQNQTIALVGSSGCGKSTTIGLLQRWYDPMGGQVSVDGKDVKDYQLKTLRGEMALVGQEPVLFDMSIRENILYGHEHPESVTEDDIEHVSKMSNIVEFLDKLPERLETRVGEKGSQLSGGQKQRVAIARALIRKPKILLLDEATSALDSESEKMVQQALDRAIEGRTTITIAHRLSTIQNADVICVVRDGKVIEKGKHFELLALNGVYKGLVDQQDLDALNG